MNLINVLKGVSSAALGGFALMLCYVGVLEMPGKYSVWVNTKVVLAVCLGAWLAYRTICWILDRFVTNK
jgi:hypothetical protein